MIFLYGSAQTEGTSSKVLAEKRWGRAASVLPRRGPGKAEGEGYESVAQWRAAHEKFWKSEELREFLKDPEFVVDDDSLVVAECFRGVPYSS